MSDMQQSPLYTEYFLFAVLQCTEVAEYPIWLRPLNVFPRAINYGIK